MKFLIGEKSEFAIEVEITKPGASPFGFVLVWINGIYIGAHEDEVPILVFLHRIKRVLDLEIDGCNFPGDVSDVVFRKVLKGEIEDGDKYRLGLGESFDDFSIIGYRNDSDVTIIWCISESPFFDYPDYPKGVHSSAIPIDAFTGVISQFEQLIISATA
jgi:hypothetical protein